MNWNLLTYDEAKSIATEATDALFYEATTEVDGYKISMFNYRLANYSDFIKYNANELRGLTFVFDKDGSYKRYLMLHKFWNLNQVEETLYNNVKDFKIKNVMTKEDGSLISFIKLPNGKVMARSKMSLISDQAVAATNLYNTNNDIKVLVDVALNNDIALFFEYVSRENKIVLDYSKEDLILLKARDNNTGDYIDIENEIVTNVNTADFHNYTLDEVIELANTTENMEGWVIETENNLMKIKTDWYFTRHKLFTEQLNRANDVVKLILDEEIDDVLAQLSDSEADMAKRDWIEGVEKAVSNYISTANNNIERLVNDYKGDRKEFALTYRKDKWFSMAMNVINGKDKYEGIKQRLFKDTYHLKEAENWIKVYG